MTHTEIVNKVKSILNEHGEADAVSISYDRVQLEDYIYSAIPDAVIMLAQKGYAVNVGIKMFTVTTMGNTSVTDFVSLLEASGSEWKRIVTTLTPKDSPEYKMAQNKFTVPKAHSPIVWMERGASNTFHFLPDSKDVKIVYNKAYNEDDGINAEPKEATAVCYMTAALVLGMFGDDQGKQRLSDISTNMLQ